MKKILITGSSGFVGRNLSKYLFKKYKLFVPIHKQLDLLDTTRVFHYISKNKIEIIIHTASMGGQRNFNKKTDIIYYNLKMFFNLVRCQKFFRKMIFLGSGAEYDKSRDLVKVKESNFDEYIPQDAYGFYKYVCSKYIEKSDKIINLRLFGVYGKYEDYKTRFISNAICKMLFNLPITINQNVYFDYLYIDDLTRIIDHFIQHKTKYKFYNIGRGSSVDLISLAKIILKIGRKKLPIKILKKGLNKEYTGNISRLQKEIINFKYSSLNDSIEKLIRYYRTILPSIKKEELYEANKDGN